MNDPIVLLTPFVTGIAVGAMTALVLATWRSGLSRQVRVVTALTGLSVDAWLITETNPLWAAMGHAYPLILVAYPVGGMFWLFVVTLFADRRVTWLSLAPPVLLLVTGIAMGLAKPPFFDPLWFTRNLAGGLLAIHAGLIVVRSWPGDLVEGRRRLRGPVLGVAALFTVFEVSLGIANRFDPTGPWLRLAVGQIGGGAVMAILALTMAALFLQARPQVFGASRRPEAPGESAGAAADLVTLRALDAVMTAEGWRREGLTIGVLAGELGVPEHRLRRLINHRLGHRNFAEFLNAHRIEAARRRLSDPREARTTVAVIAFDLGYGSLGPFNRAFRAATGASPTEWRARALRTSPDLRESV